MASWLVRSTPDRVVRVRALAGVGSNIAVNEDEAIVHATTNTGSSSTSNDDVTATHFGARIVATAVKNGDGAAFHHVASEVASHAFTDDGRALIGSPEKTSCVPLQGERAAASKGRNPRTEDTECAKSCTLRKGRAQPELTVFGDGVASIGPSNSENGVLFCRCDEARAQFFVDVHRAQDDLGNTRHGPWSCPSHKYTAVQFANEF